MTDRNTIKIRHQVLTSGCKLSCAEINKKIDDLLTIINSDVKGINKDNLKIEAQEYVRLMKRRKNKEAF